MSHCVSSKMSSELLSPSSSSHFLQNIGIVITLSFFIYVLLAVAFFALVVRYLTGAAPSSIGPTVTAVSALTLASLPTALLPIDIFIVGYMKNVSGDFQSWASDSLVRRDVGTIIMSAYYASYIAVLINIFLVIPVVYIFQKNNEIDYTRNRKGILYALCHAAVYILALAILFTIGIFVPTRDLPIANSTFRNVIQELETNQFEDILAFAINVIRVIGMCLITAYVAVGLAAGPIGLLCGYKDPREELSMVRNRRSGVEIEIAAIQEIRNNLAADGSESVRSEDIRWLELEQEDLDLKEREVQLLEDIKHWLAQLVSLSRPLQIVTGLIGGTVGLIIFTSELMTNIIRSMFSLGEKFGYLMPSVYLTNPLDGFFLIIQGLFPVDFAVIVVLMALFVLAAISGCHRLGVGIPWIKIYEVVPWKTQGRPLLAVTMILTTILMSLDVFLYSMLPQYATYSSQQYAICSYPNLPTPLPDQSLYSTASLLIKNECETEVKPCNWSSDAPEGECVMTRLAVLMTRMSYKTWYFGAIINWLSWIFLVVVVVEACVATSRRFCTSRYQVD